MLHIKQRIANHRKQVQKWPPLPRNREAIDLSSMMLTEKKENFILCDSGAEDVAHLLVFGTAQNVQILCSSWRLFIDGTFKLALRLYYQMYTIHAMKADHVFPLVYALLPDKKSRTYKLLFQALKSVKPDLSPRFVTLDFEKAAMKAFCVSSYVFHTIYFNEACYNQ
jgi:hypothetical protein